MSESFDSTAVTWTKYATADELASYCDLGWKVSSYYAKRGPHECYVIEWAGQGMPRCPESNRRGEMSKKRSVSQKTRFDVFKRDGFVCQYCGKHPPDALLEVDHIVPISGEGSNEESNLVTSCFECNRGKGAVSLSVIPKTLAEKAAEITEREAQIAGYREVVQAQTDRIEDDTWRVAEALFPKSSETGLRRDWLQSIKAFNRKLPLHEVIDAAEIALAKKPWSEPQRFRYFCGVCWAKIKEG